MIRSPHAALRREDGVQLTLAPPVPGRRQSLTFLHEPARGRRSSDPGFSTPGLDAPAGSRASRLQGANGRHARDWFSWLSSGSIELSESIIGAVVLVQVASAAVTP